MKAWLKGAIERTDEPKEECGTCEAEGNWKSQHQDDADNQKEQERGWVH